MTSESIHMAPKRQMSFVVYACDLPSYLVKGYELTRSKLILTTYILRETKILDHVKLGGNVRNPIRICLLDHEGQVTEELKFEKYKLVDWKVNADWSNDEPMEVLFIYELNTVD